MVRCAQTQLLDRLESPHMADDVLAQHCDRVLLHRVYIDGLLVREVHDAAIVQLERALTKTSTCYPLHQVAFEVDGKIGEEERNG